MKLKKSLAEALARDIMAGRRKILRKLTPEEGWLLMRLADDLQSMAQIAWMESLADRYSRGQHHLKDHLEIEDDAEIVEFANEIAEDMRELSRHVLYEEDEPVTIERLQEAEDLLARQGVGVVLVQRVSGNHEIFPN